MVAARMARPQGLNTGWDAYLPMTGIRARKANETAGKLAHSNIFKLVSLLSTVIWTFCIGRSGMLSNFSRYYAQKHFNHKTFLW